VKLKPLTVSVTEIKFAYLACLRRYFPESQLSIRAVLARSGKLHGQFETVAQVLSAEKIDPHGYIAFCCNFAERLPSPKQLITPEWISRYQHDQQAIREDAMTRFP